MSSMSKYDQVLRSLSKNGKATTVPVTPQQELQDVIGYEKFKKM